MKKYIINNWKKILIVIGSIFIVLNIGLKLTTGNMMIDEYIENGKDIKNDLIDNIDDNGNMIETPAEIKGNPEIYRLLIILGILILGVLVISAIAESGGNSAKKKK